MNVEHLPFDAPLDDYRRQAQQLLDAHQSGNPDATCIFKQCHPRFLRSDYPWVPLDTADSEIQSAALNIEDAQLAVARCYDFRDWPALAEHVSAVSDTSSPTFRFESAAECVITGDAANLQRLLPEDPELIRARSARVTHFDPNVHRATLLHYVAANGVESYRQKSPANAAGIARILLSAGAEPDAFADMYGGQYATMSMLVSSSPPADAGVQIALIDTLVDFGAAVEALRSDKWGSPLMTALVFGFADAAEALRRRGARLDNVAAAAGLGRLDQTRALLPTADPASRHQALSLAAQHGHAAIVALLLDAGEDPDRFNPKNHHAHCTPLHQAALAGHESVVRLLVERDARLDIKDKIYNSTPLGWAAHAGHKHIESYLRAHGAS